MFGEIVSKGGEKTRRERRLKREEERRRASKRGRRVEKRKKPNTHTARRALLSLAPKQKMLEPPAHSCMIQKAPFLSLSKPHTLRVSQKRKGAKKPGSAFLVATKVSSPEVASAQVPV